MSGAGEPHLLILGILGDEIGAVGSVFRLGHPSPGGATVQAAVDAATRAREHTLWPIAIDLNREDIRILHHACVDGIPRCAPVCGLPGQVWRAGIKDGAVIRIEGEGYDWKRLSIVER